MGLYLAEFKYTYVGFEGKQEVTFSRLVRAENMKRATDKAQK